MSHSFVDFLATPIVVTAEMDESYLKYEFERMMLRMEATAEFVAGRLETSDFLDTLDGCGVNVDTALKAWSSGQSFMG